MLTENHNLSLRAIVVAYAMIAGQPKTRIAGNNANSPRMDDGIWAL